MHLVDASIGHLGSNAIVGGHIPIATGAALWTALRGEHRVVASFFGDGATSEGIFHESVNFAAVQRLPIVFVVENNQWAMSLPWAKSTAQQSIEVKAEGYGIAGVDVDGQDVLAVRTAARDAIGRARRGEGPTLLGLSTYRFLGHSRADPSSYRDKAEEEKWRLRDPVLLAHNLLMAHDFDEEWFEQVDRDIAAEIAAAIEIAENSPPASIGEVFSDNLRHAAGRNPMISTLTPPRTVTYREALREALFEEMEADDRVIVMGEDVCKYGGAYAVSKGLLERFGDRRVIDTPMSEALIVGAALGAAVVGGRPVAEIMYMDFVTLTMDALVNQAAKLHFMFGGQLSAPMVVRLQQGVGPGA